MCVSPVLVKPSGTWFKESHLVPCGKCVECLRDYQNAWKLRISEEALHGGYTSACFVTLTYSNDAVPCRADVDTGEVEGVFFNDRYARCYTFDKRSVQNWLKRFRMARDRKFGVPDMTKDERDEFRKTHPFKYFLTAEYGPTTLRPHYHAVFLGVSVHDLHGALSWWKKNKGFISAKDIPLDQENSGAVANYVAKYCAKGVFENPMVKQGKVDKPFKLISKGLGSTYIDRMKKYHRFIDGVKMHVDNSFHYTQEYLENVCSRLHVTAGDPRRGFFRYKMPRYWRSKIFGTQNLLSFEIADYVRKRVLEVRDTQLATFIRERSNLSLSEVYLQYNLAQESSLEIRTQCARSTLAKFFSSSKI